MRTEKDYLGELQIPQNAFYGIHSLRAKNNFPFTQPFNINWYKAMGQTKLACYLTYKDFKHEVKQYFGQNKIPLKLIEDQIIELMIETAEEISQGKYYEHFIVPALQGGAGTSINMNINEIIANVCLQKKELPLGTYSIIDPIEHANIYQSTNDVVPTALKVAIMLQLVKLEDAINQLRFQTEELERKYRNTLRIGYTQMQEAVPSSYGKLFSSYNEALGRDWWRISKCFERIKIVNLGGSAIGTSLTVPRYFVMEIVQKLRQITQLPITRSENLIDATNNLDSIVEVHGILNANAVNLEKIASDIRLLASDIAGKKEIKIPQKQVGSSIMPSKINPVITEFVVCASHKVYTNNILVNQLSALGVLELNAYIPLIGHSILESIEMLTAANQTLKENLFEGLEIFENIALENLLKSPAISTALIPVIGYNKASEIAKTMRTQNIDIYKANEILNFTSNQIINEILKPDNLLKNGFSLKDFKI